MLYSGVMWITVNHRRQYYKRSSDEQRELVNIALSVDPSKIMWIFGQRWDHFDWKYLYDMFDFDQEKQQLRETTALLF